MLNAQTSRSSEQGFTLVELAIVMVIIGLLIGGILKGQELIANAKVSATVSQLKSLDAAFNTFQDKYNAVPGDMISPDTRLANCAGICATDGNGNSRIDSPTFGTFPGTGDEAGRAFLHLGVSDLVSGIDATGNEMTYGRLLPTVKAGGGMWVSFANTAPANTGVTIGRHYAILNGDTTGVGNETGAFNASTAAQIDRKLDDGRPQTGSVSVVGGGCVAGTVYDEANDGGTCAMYVRVMN